MNYIIAYDLGTGGTKTSLFDENGNACASTFISCDTHYPHNGWHEQRPYDWWRSVVQSTHALLEQNVIDAGDIVSLAVSGHSLGVTPIGENGDLLVEFVPIWSDARADRQARRFFECVDEHEWYRTTGNGFPAHLYSVFKLMWYKEHFPEVYAKTSKFIGSKDYINFKMTGVLCTDRSYASGSGVYSLLEERYLDEYIRVADIDGRKLPEVYPSTQVLGTLLPAVAQELGLPRDIRVCAGGVDNSCMALGAGCIDNGDAYTSLGSSSWIAVSSDKPIVNEEKRPFVFAHCVPERYVSATAIFAAGRSLQWVRNQICPDLLRDEENGGEDSYDVMNRLAATSPVGANKLIFNPSLAGGSSLDKSANVRGCFTGLDLMHTRADLIRAAMEGVCLNLRLALEVLSQYVELSENMLLVGGGGKSRFWRSLFASIYEKNIIETNVGQDAGSLGAAALAAVGVGLWSGFDRIKSIHREQEKIQPDPEDARIYRAILPVYAKIADMQSDIGDMLADLKF